MRVGRKSDDDSFGKCRIGALSSLIISTVFLSMPVHAQESQLVKITGALHSEAFGMHRRTCPSGTFKRSITLTRSECEHEMTNSLCPSG